MCEYLHCGAMKSGWKAIMALSSTVIALCLLCTAPMAYAAEEPLTRGEMAQLIVDTFELQYDESMATSFSDVPRESPYYEAVSILVSNSILDGVGGNYFGVNSTVNRAQAATFLYRTGLPKGILQTIPEDVPDWAFDGVNSALSYDVMSVDTDGRFRGSDRAYASDINVDAIEELYGPNTTEAIRFDLTNGSISISRNLKGVMVFQQGETVLRTRSQSALIQQSNTAAPTANTITVESGEVTLSIVDLNIESETSPIAVSAGAKLTLNLLGSTTLKCIGTDSSKRSAGISTPDGAKLTIQGNGAVSVTTAGDYSAGIGGENRTDAGAITITSGVVTATGGRFGAGIGGGDRGNGGVITINGGTVTATGGEYYGAGIGGGDLGDGGIIAIKGGTVVATGKKQSAGIGGGSQGDGGVIKITGGAVTASSIQGGSGIGGGYEGSGGSVTITNATVRADGYYHAIGGGSYDNAYGSDCITIADTATVTTKCTSTSEAALKQFVPYQERIDCPAVPNVAALSGNSACIQLTASGASGISYQWQESTDNTNWTNIDGQTSSTVSILMSAENDGRHYRCRLTNGWGNVVYTESAQAFVLAFTQQPQSVETGLDDVSTFSVTASCANVTYQWQRSYDDGVTWTNVPGEIYSTLVVDATLSENDALYRCVITATNGDVLASDAARITVNSAAITYTTRYYLERADGTGYDLTDQSVTEASAGANVTAIERTFEHFTENTASGTLTGTVKADNSLILSRYYDRDSYTISYETNGGAALGTDSVKYGAAISLPTPAKLGCTFDGWYRDAELAQAFTDTAMPGENLTLYAKWSVVGAGRGVEYRINGITLRDSAYQSVRAIPRGTFYAEVSVINLCAEATDTLVLATYDSNGKMLGMSFLYANPQIGQTFVLGTGIDNSKGEVAKLKAFMLPVLGGLTPLAESAELGI